MKIEIKNFSGKVIFSHEQENNTIKLTLEAAIKARANMYNADLTGANLSDADLSRADLYRADLSDADLTGADLSRANLYRADLSDADLTGADLSRANLSGADLSSAKLTGANLYGADLSGADLTGANILCFGDMNFIFTMQIDTWAIGFTKDLLKIGCQCHEINKWREFSDDEISKMDSNALAWWKRWKSPLFAIIDEKLKDFAE